MCVQTFMVLHPVAAVARCTEVVDQQTYFIIPRVMPGMAKKAKLKEFMMGQSNLNIDIFME